MFLGNLNVFDFRVVVGVLSLFFFGDVICFKVVLFVVVFWLGRRVDVVGVCLSK